MSGHGWGRSRQGIERRNNADSKTRLDKWVDNVFGIDSEEKDKRNLLRIQELQLFLPDTKTEKLYNEQIKKLFEYKGSNTEIINMGRLPAVYNALGIADKELKTNGITILKALGIEGHNKHNVSKDTIENLLFLAYDPIAVFKSLSASDNPNAYIAVLNAKAENQDQIIAILSPSRNRQGFTFIPSVYEKHNFERFLGRVNDEQKVLYIKNKGSKLWGQLQSLPRRNPEPSDKNILTKSDIVKHFFSYKEKTMTNELKNSPQQHAWIKMENVNFHHERLYHAFGNLETEFIISRRDINLTDNPFMITLHDRFNSIPGDYSRTFRISGDGNDAKKLAENTIEHFDKKQNVKIYDIEGYISEQVKKQQLQKISEHITNNSVVRSDGSLRVDGRKWSEMNRKLNEGKPFFGDILKFALTNDRLPTDTEIAKMPTQGSPSARRADKNIFSKEHTMSDEFEEAGINEQKESLSPKEQAFLNAVHQRKVIADAVKNGTLCCLPGENGQVDTTPATDVVRGKNYKDADMLYLKAHQKENGFHAAQYITAEMFNKAKEDDPNLYIRQGQKSVSLYTSEKNDAGEWKEKRNVLFNIAQANRPDKLMKWVEQKHEEDRKAYLEWGRTQYGNNWEPEEKKYEKGGPEIVCSSTEPEKYLGQYFAAVSMGRDFKASKEQAAEFSQKMIDTLYAKLTNKETGEFIIGKNGEPVTDPFSLDKLSYKAGVQCKEFMTGLRMEEQKMKQPEQNLEQQQSRGRGM